MMNTQELKQQVKHRYFKMGAGTTYQHVGFWYPITGKTAKDLPELALQMQEGKPDICQGICDHCGTKIVYHHIIADENGQQFVVGSECIKKLDDVQLIEVSEKVEKEALKAKKVQVRNMMDKKEREINGGLTNKEMRKKLAQEIAEQTKEKRIIAAQPVLDMIKTYHTTPSKKDLMWEYNDSAKLREKLKDPRQEINQYLINGLRRQIELYGKMGSISDNSTEINSKLEMLDERLNVLKSEVEKMQKEEQELLADLRLKY
ncbi:MAG: hypothetical protein ACRCTW_05100 [Lactococcus garvieae]